ncbi:MAG: hypothetical protein ACRDT6_03770 [Micromonosporaceae bacterium]
MRSVRVRLGVPVAALLVAGLALLGAPGAVQAAPPATVDHVVVVGAAGLRWDDVNPTDTPRLWRLAGGAAIGSMAVRSAQAYTCPADGWLTVGAGNRVRRHTEPADPGCSRPLPTVTPGGGGGAVVTEHRRLLEDNERLTYRARPGALAELVECSVAVGPGAALAAARPGVGRVDRYFPALPDDPAPALARCPLAMVDAGAVAADGRTQRRDQARRVDALLGRVLDARPERSLVLVAGIADTGGTARLHVALADGPGVDPGTLTAWRSGYARLVDVAPTVVAALGLPSSRWFAGGAMSVSPASTPLAERVAALRDADRAAAVQPRRAYGFGIVLVLVQLLLFGAAIPVLWRIRRAAATEDESHLVWTAAERALEIVAVAVSLVIPATLLADLVPWWRSGSPGLALAGVTLVVLAALTAVIRLVPWWRNPLWPIGGVAGVTVAVIAADLVTGSHLQLDSVTGYGAVEGGRIVGLSEIGAGAFTVAVLLLGGYLAQQLPRTRGPLLVAAVGGVGVVLAGIVGVDPGSAIALTAGVCLAVVMCTGSWLTATRLLAATFVGVAVAGAFVLLNLYPRPEHRGRLGRYVTEVTEGAPGALLHRTAEANAITFGSSPLTVLVLAGVLFGGLVLLRPSGGLLRVYGLYPAIRAALIGSGVAAVLGGLVDGAGVVVVGAATATAVPLATLLCLRTLARAHLRSAPVLPAPDDPDGPDGGATGKGSGEDGPDGPDGPDGDDGTDAPQANTEVTV